MAAYYKNRPHYLKSIRAWRKQHIKKCRQFAHEYLRQHPCIDCGIADPVVLQFDHVRGKKVSAVALLVRGGYPLKKIIQEIKKCDVRCANCHARKTAIERKYFSYLTA